MPIFEYTCEACHERSEILLKGREEPECPNCGSHQLHKELSTFATQSDGSRPMTGSGGQSHGAGCGCCMGPGGCGLN